MNHLDDVQAHFDDALAFCRKAGYRPELAWSLCDYADMLLERNDDGDRQKAMQSLDESSQISTGLVMLDGLSKQGRGIGKCLRRAYRYHKNNGKEDSCRHRVVLQGCG